MENIYKTIYVVYRQPHMPKVEEAPQPQSEDTTKIDAAAPYEFKFKILAEYM